MVGIIENNGSASSLQDESSLLHILFISTEIRFMQQSWVLSPVHTPFAFAACKVNFEADFE